MRKIVQLYGTKENPDVALCNDGTVWIYFKGYWTCQKSYDIPQDDYVDTETIIEPIVLKEPILSSFEKISLCLINELDFTARVQHCLLAGNIFFVGELLQKKENDLLKIPNLGAKSLKEIRFTLDIFYLHLKTKIENWEGLKSLFIEKIQLPLETIHNYVMGFKNLYFHFKKNEFYNDLKNELYLNKKKCTYEDFCNFK